MNGAVLPAAPPQVWRLTPAEEGEDATEGAEEASLFRPTAVSPLFISHGAPFHATDDSSDEALCWKRLGALYLNADISGIVAISAHWEEEYPTVTVGDRDLPTIHDFYGFPRQLYEVRYQAKCESDLADRVGELLAEAGMQPRAEEKRGLDHGAWVPLLHMFPKGNIPIVQVSLMKNLNPEDHWQLGKALAPLKDEGVLVMGSGGATHNLRSIDLTGGRPPSWAEEFNTWLHDTITAASTVDAAEHLRKIGNHPSFDLAHPRIEHALPILVAAAAAIGEAEETAEARASVARPSMLSTGEVRFSFLPSNNTGIGKRAIAKWEARSLSMDSYIFFPFEER